MMRDRDGRPLLGAAAAGERMAQEAMAPPRGLGDQIDDHRIWFEVERETAQQGEQRLTTGVRVWLWGTVPKRAGALPGSPGCRDAVAALQHVAAAAIARAQLDPAAQVEPFRWRLYASRQVADADEVKLGIRVRASEDASGAADAERERALGRLKDALGGVGVAEGAWRPSAAA